MGGGHDHDPRGFAIQNKAQVQFLRDVGSAFDPHTVDTLAIGISLLGDQLLAKEGGSESMNLDRRLAQFYPARSATPTGMDRRSRRP